MSLSIYWFVIWVVTEYKPDKCVSMLLPTHFLVSSSELEPWMKPRDWEWCQFVKNDMAACGDVGYYQIPVSPKYFSNYSTYLMTLKL